LVSGLAVDGVSASFSLGAQESRRRKEMR